MAFDIFSTAVLNRLLVDRRQPPSFLLDTFFPEVIPATQDEIYFDDVTVQRRLAPFVSPLREGQVVDMPGFKTHSFKPAYVKDKRVFEAHRRLRRSPGSPIGAVVSPAAQMEEAIQWALNDQLTMLTRREEWMASSALRLGQITVVGEGYPSTVVSFSRPSGHTVVLSGGSRWGQSGVSPWANLQTWAATVQAANGGFPRTVVMDPKAWTLFAADPEVQRLQQLQAYTQNPALNPQPQSGYREDQEQDVVARGTLGPFTQIFTYQSTYQDDTGTAQQMLPDYTVILAAEQRMQGARCYGFVKDHEQGFTADRYFVKSWLNPDPSVRFFLMQSAPLVVPFRPYATFAATVN